jgi:ABC-type uncharacterized transport system fused permease/ATPase subunit
LACVCLFSLPARGTDLPFPRSIVPCPFLPPCSGGEQQRLGFARLLYQRPAFALLDESTSAMDVALEEHCMRAALAAGIACVSVGHRPSLRPFHTSCLTLDGTGGAVLTALT